jgi:hypothetical protein
MGFFFRNGGSNRISPELLIFKKNCHFLSWKKMDFFAFILNLPYCILKYTLIGENNIFNSQENGKFFERLRELILSFLLFLCFPIFAVKLECLLNHKNACTVKLGYNELGYNEHSVITNTRLKQTKIIIWLV